MPQDFNFPSRETALWTPFRFQEKNDDYQDRNNNYLHAAARLKRGVSLEQARSEMTIIARQLARAYPKELADTGATVILLRDEVSPKARLLLKVLLLAAIGVLLIACTNLANLLLTRALARRRELAVRTAMGAGRDRLVRQLLTESLVLAFCGGALGVAIAVGATPLIVRLVPNSLPIAAAPQVDLRMLVFAALLTAATGIAFGVVPALRACRDADTSGLSEGSRTGAGRRTERLRSMLVVAEVTASVVLLIASGLLVRALWKLQAIDPGFHAEGVLTLRTALPFPNYEKTDQRVLLYQVVLSEVRRLPGVSSAAYISGLPMAMRGGVWGITLEGHPEDPAHDHSASLRYVTPGFFATLGIPIRSGRDVADTDTLTSPFVAVVSESFSKQNWPGENPIGRRFKFAFDQRMVVGVVGDVRVRGSSNRANLRCTCRTSRSRTATSSGTSRKTSSSDPPFPRRSFLPFAGSSRRPIRSFRSQTSKCSPTSCPRTRRPAPSRFGSSGPLPRRLSFPRRADAAAARRAGPRSARAGTR